MKTLITGGRDFTWSPFIYEALDLLHDRMGITEVTVGDATGVDSISSVWAKDMEIPVRLYRAKWRQHGRAAGPIRNKQMLESEPDVVVAFPGGKGTAHMKRIATEVGIRVIEIDYLISIRETNAENCLPSRTDSRLHASSS